MKETLGSFRDFWKRKAGKVQIISEAAWIVAVVLALHMKNEFAFVVLPIIGAGVVCSFVGYGFWELDKK